MIKMDTVCLSEKLDAYWVQSPSYSVNKHPISPYHKFQIGILLPVTYLALQPTVSEMSAFHSAVLRVLAWLLGSGLLLTIQGQHVLPRCATLCAMNAANSNNCFM
jgi:hypothetical protein